MHTLKPSGSRSLGGSVKLSLLDASEWGTILGRDADEQAPSVLTIVQAYRSVGFFRRCVALRAGALAGVPFVIESRGSVLYDSASDDDPPEDIAFASSLPDYLMEGAQGYVLAGAAYALILQQGGRIQGLQPWNPFSAKPVITPAGIAYVERRVNGITRHVAAEDVLQVYNADPLVEIGPGSPDAGAALLSADVLDALTGFRSRHLRSGLVSGTVVLTKSIIPDRAWEAIKTLFNRFLRGGRGASGIVNIPSESEIVQIGEGFKGLASLDLTREEREAIATALGVPHGLVMSNETGAKATSEQDWINLYDTTVLPDARVFARAMNTQIFEPMGYRLKFQPARLPAFQKAELEKAKAVRELVGGPVYTREEGRLMLGLDAAPSEGEFLTPQPRLPGAGPEAALADAEKRLAERYPTLKLLAA